MPQVWIASKSDSSGNGTSGSSSTTGSWLLYLVAYTFGAIAIIYVALFSVDVPYFDEWHFVPLVLSWNSGDGSWYDLVSEYNGHRILFHKSVAVLSAALTGWDIRAEMLCGLLFVFGTCSVFVRYLDRYTDSGMYEKIFVTIVISSLLFSFRQWENFLAPWAMAWFPAIFFGVFTLYLLSTNRSKLSFGVACVSGIFSALSFGVGLVVWPIGVFLCRGWLKVPWIVLGSVLFFMYSGSQPKSEPLDIINSAGRILVLAGSTFTLDKGVISGNAVGSATEADLIFAGILGIVFLVFSMLVVALKGRIEHPRFPLSVLSFGLGASFLIALGRADLGLLQALSPRYFSIVVLAPIGMIIAVYSWKSPPDIVSKLRVCFAGALILTTLFSLISEAWLGQYRRQYFENWAANIRNHRIATDAELQNPHFSPETIRELSSEVDRAGLTLFRHRE